MTMNVKFLITDAPDGEAVDLVERISVDFEVTDWAEDEEGIRVEVTDVGESDATRTNFERLAKALREVSHSHCSLIVMIDGETLEFHEDAWDEVGMAEDRDIYDGVIDDAAEAW